VTGILEIACFNNASALIAERAGADRVELCEDYEAGGITPGRELILKTRQIKLPLYVLIRPRGGNFVFSTPEKKVMRGDIIFCRENKVDGIVTGALTKDGLVDVPFMTELVELARPMDLTFHRAIDECTDVTRALSALISLGIKRVLLSGSSAHGTFNAAHVAHIIQMFGKEITIVAGGNIRASNIGQLSHAGCYEFHSSAITGSEKVADAFEIQRLREIINGLNA
jgi:copper homeostasis protein